MHTMIVVVKMPETSHNEAFSQSWANYLGDVDGLRKSSPEPLHMQAGIARLAENVWQVDMQQNPAAGARLIYFATQYKFAYGILPLDAAPRWLPAGFDPNTISARSG